MAGDFELFPVWQVANVSGYIDAFNDTFGFGHRSFLLAASFRTFYLMPAGVNPRLAQCWLGDNEEHRHLARKKFYKIIRMLFLIAKCFGMTAA